MTTDTTLEPEYIEEICDAFGKGYDQWRRILKNPYSKGSDLYHAYEYGKLMGTREN